MVGDTQVVLSFRHLWEDRNDNTVSSAQPEKTPTHLRVDLVIPSFPFCDNVLGCLFEMCMQSQLSEVLRLPRTQWIKDDEHPALLAEITRVCTA